MANANAHPMRAGRKVRQKLHNAERLLKGAIAVIKPCPVPASGGPDWRPTFDVITIADHPLEVTVEGMESRTEAALRQELQRVNAAYAAAEAELEVMQERVATLSKDLIALGETAGSWLRE